MKTTIIIHGSPDKDEYYDRNEPSPSNAHWIPWLQKKLYLKDEISIAPEMPKPYDPRYRDWENVMDNFKIDSNTVLIGHSSGAGFLLRYCTERAKHPHKLVLVAPWIDPDNELSERFFNFEIDPKLVSKTKVHIFMSEDDSASCLKSFEIIEGKLPDATYHKYKNKDHFCTDEFSELLDIL